MSGVTLKPATLAELRDGADWIVDAVVKSVRAEHSDEPNSYGVQTRILLDDTHVLKGSTAPVGGFQVIRPGGVLEGKRIEVPGAPTFVPGERVVLFLRDIGNGETAILAHGMGVLRKSADGSRVVPDVTVGEGTPRMGEAYRLFVARLAGANANNGSIEGRVAPEDKRAADGPSIGALIAAAGLILFCIVMFSRYRSRVIGAAIILLCCGLVVVLAAGRAAADSSAQSRDYQLNGGSWDLKTPLPRRVRASRVLWAQGQGSRSLNDSDAFATIAAQFQKWEDVPTSAIAFQQEGKSIVSGNEIDERNVISFSTSLSRSSFDSFTLAVTFTRINPVKKNNEDADTVFNDRDFVWVIGQGTLALEVVALHEFGHFLGLAHTNDPADVMYPTAGGLRQLSPGDKAGATFLYPLSARPELSAAAAASPIIGGVPLTAFFSSDGSITSNGNLGPFSWDFGDGSAPSSEASPAHTYAVPGKYTATLTVNDGAGGTDSATVSIVAGAPTQTVTVSKQSFQAALQLISEKGGKDRMGFILNGLDLKPGDSIQLRLRDEFLTAVDLAGNAVPAIIGAKGFGGESGFGGKLDLNYDSKKQTLTVKLSGAKFLRALDPRDPNDIAQAGTATFPILLLGSRNGGSLFGYSADMNFSYRISSKKSANGVIENTIQGKP